MINLSKTTYQVKVQFGSKLGITLFAGLCCHLVVSASLALNLQLLIIPIFKNYIMIQYGALLVMQTFYVWTGLHGTKCIMTCEFCRVQAGQLKMLSVSGGRERKD